MTRARSRAARDKLVLNHLDLVQSIAERLKSRLPPCFDLDDLVQAGRIGLLQAAQSFDPKENPGVPFGAYARQRITGEIKESVGLHNDDGERRLSREHRWEQATRPPIAEHAILPQQFPGHAFEGPATFRPRDTPDRAARADNVVQMRERTEQIDQAMRILPKREQVIIDMYYLRDRDLGSLALTKQFPVRRSWLSQLHTRALRKMRHELEEHGIQQAA